MRMRSESAAMLELSRRGWSISRIAAEFDVDPRTVRRYVRAGSWPGYKPRERSSRTMACRGSTNSDIARVLGITEGTVRYHAKRAQSDAVDGRTRQSPMAASVAAAIDHWRGMQVNGVINLAQLHAWLIAEHGYPGSLRSVQRYWARSYPAPWARARRRNADPWEHVAANLSPWLEQRVVPQWQKSKGSLILIAALELSTNQVTHFYSGSKNTTEMIRMMDLLVEQYAHCRKIYLSWDAASWHISKRLGKRIEQHNATAGSKCLPIVETAPLPAGAQFLNVIESVFSGMARAIMHNGNHRSVDDAKEAIDRSYEERNLHFQQNSRRAGKKIWSKEREHAVFNEGNNCKDPYYR
jgi:DDE superfamily endonuclease/Homeodomain-like domain/Bacterial regulatory proteins, luxR family